MLLQQDIKLNTHSYYEHTVSRPKQAEPLNGTVVADVCIVGGGFAGLSAAIELRKKGYDVVVLEGQQIGFGASGRNGGQVIAGYSDDSAIPKALGKDLAKLAWDISIEGISLLRERIEEHKIDCDFQPGFMFVSTSEKKAKQLNDWIHENIEHYDYPHYQFYSPEHLSEMINSPQYVNGVYDGFSGHLHPLKYALGLASVAKALGVKIYEYSPVIDLQTSHNSSSQLSSSQLSSSKHGSSQHGSSQKTVIDKKTIVSTQNGSKCIAKYVLLAGNVYLNAYGKPIAPKLQSRILPVGTYITVSEPIDPELVNHLIPCKAAICNTDLQLDYFRFTPDNRMLFGGDVAVSKAIPKDFAEKVQARMTHVFPELAKTKIDFMWGGHVDMTMNLAPDFGRLDSNIYYLQGFSGHGVALTGIAGKLVAEAIAGDAERFDIFTKIKHRRFIGGERFRTPTLMLGMWFHQVREWLS